MQRCKYVVAVISLISLVGCAAGFPLLEEPPKRAASPPATFTPPNDYVPIEQVQIASRFDTVEVTKDTLENEVSNCLKKEKSFRKTRSKAEEDFPSDNLVEFRYSNSVNVFWLQQTTGVCLHKSSEKFPIFAAEAFLDTVNPEGVPTDVADGWYKQLAMLIATKGKAKVAYVFGTGKAALVDYWVESPKDRSNNSSFFKLMGWSKEETPFDIPVNTSALHYSSALKEAGTWEKANLDARFSHPSMTSVTEVKEPGNKFFPLLHRFKENPAGTM